MSYSYVKYIAVIPQQALLLYHIHITAFEAACSSVDWGRCPRSIWGIAATLGKRWRRWGYLLLIRVFALNLLFPAAPTFALCSYFMSRLFPLVFGWCVSYVVINKCSPIGYIALPTSPCSH